MRACRAVLAVVAAVVVWALVLRDGGVPAAGPPDADAPEDVAAPRAGDGATAEDPTEVPEPDLDTRPGAVDPELEALRASDRDVALAEHEHAREHDWPPGVVGAWNGFRRGNCTNLEELWDEVVGPIRDDALLAGEPYSDPVWNEIGIPAMSPLAWSDEQTGRGDLFMYRVVYTDPGSGGPVVGVHAVLVRKDAYGHGAVVARMPPFEIRREDVADFTEASQLRRERVWEWVQQQPPTSKVDR